MAKPTRTEIGLWILAAIGAGALIGAVVGLLLGRRGVGQDATTGSVDELKERAEHVLGELSGSVDELVGRSRRRLRETPRRD
jgi:hypothetical protein